MCVCVCVCVVSVCVRAYVNGWRGQTMVLTASFCWMSRRRDCSDCSFFISLSRRMAISPVLAISTVFSSLSRRHPLVVALSPTWTAAVAAAVDAVGVGAGAGTWSTGPPPPHHHHLYRPGRHQDRHPCHTVIILHVLVPIDVVHLHTLAGDADGTLRARHLRALVVCPLEHATLPCATRYSRQVRQSSRPNAGAVIQHKPERVLLWLS